MTAPGSKTWTYTYNALGQPTQVSIPNGMTTVYTYDTRNRLTKIEHKDGSTVLDGWTYSLDDQGNITRTDQADGSYWTYGYDGRYRLTTADRYEASGSTIRAQYAYGYDAADNLTAKTEPFLDDFEDGNATGWTLGTGWSASTKVMKETNSASTRFHRALSKHDVDIRFRYMTTDTTAGLFGEMCFRTISNNVTQNNVVVRMATDGMKLQKVYLGNTTVLANNTSATSTANTWYRVRILAKGANVTVWRGEGDDGPMERVLSTTSAPTMTPASMWFISGANAAFAYDDIAIIADGWTSGTTFAVNGGNELTSSTFGGVTTTYGYDAWGNMTSKARGSYSASYAWHYGGKLTGVTSTFPGEGAVTYAYGGDGKRRERTAGGTTRSYWWTGGVQAQSQQVGSDTSTRRTYIDGLGHYDTATASDSTYRYYGTDHLGSTRALWESDLDLASAYEYDPYGAAYANFGPGTTRRYTGHDWDAALDGYYAPFRYYSPESTRWLSRDPLGTVDGSNSHNYVDANPVLFEDPFGLAPAPTRPVPPSLPDVGRGGGGGIGGGLGGGIGGRMPGGGGTLALPGPPPRLALPAPPSRPALPPPQPPQPQPTPPPAPPKPQTPPPPPAPAPTVCPTPAPRSPGWPGNDPTQAPPGTTWRGQPGSTPGSPQGNFHNPATRESYHPDLSHEPPYGPHWDYRAPDGIWHRIFPDGTMKPK